MLFLATMTIRLYVLRAVGAHTVKPALPAIYFGRRGGRRRLVHFCIHMANPSRRDRELFPFLSASLSLHLYSSPCVACWGKQFFFKDSKNILNIARNPVMYLSIYYACQEWHRFIFVTQISA